MGLTKYSKVYALGKSEAGNILDHEVIIEENIASRKLNPSAV